MNCTNSLEEFLNLYLKGKIVFIGNCVIIFSYMIITNISFIQIFESLTHFKFNLILEYLKVER